MHNLYLFQPQYRVSFNDKDQYWFPYAVGCLWSYAKQFEVAKTWDLKRILFKREPIDKVIKTIVNPSLCAFSVYIWNEKYCLRLAKEIKVLWPNCVIAFGGPQVSSHYTKYSFIDTMVIGEGEPAFVSMLQKVVEGKEPQLFYNEKRMDSLDTVPSPYVDGTFDHLIEQNPNLFWSAPFETNRGCPYSCTFCDWGGLTRSKVKKFSLERIVNELAWLKDKKIRTMFLTDANFGIFKERDLEIANLLRQFSEANGNLEYIAMNYAKNSNEHVFKIAQAFGKINKGITFSVQSMNPDTLEEIKRKNMDVGDIKTLMKLSAEYNIPHYTEVILGLPHETLSTWKSGIAELLELGQHSRIDVLFNMILDNTEMKEAQVGPFKLKTIEADDVVAFSVDEETGIKETAPIVVSTSTMTTDEIVEAFIYTWMVIAFHIGGYSMNASMALRAKGIAYRRFYDKLFERIFELKEANRIQNATKSLLTRGNTLTKGLYPTNLAHSSTAFMNENIDQVNNLVRDTVRSFGITVDYDLKEKEQTLKDHEYFRKRRKAA